MARRWYGSGQLLGTVAGVLTERAREEAEILVAEGGVEERVVTELFRVRMVEMDVVKAAVGGDHQGVRRDDARSLPTGHPRRPLALSMPGTLQSLL